MNSIQSIKGKTLTSREIAQLSSKLTPKNQTWVLNTINTLLFTQESDPHPTDPPQKKELQEV